MKYFLWGQGSRGLQIYFPLNPKLAVIYYDSKVYKAGSANKEFIDLQRENDVISLNKLIAVSANEILIAKNSFNNQQELLNLSKLHENISKQERIGSFELGSDKKNIVAGNSIKSKHFGMILTFMKEKPFYSLKKKSDFKNEDRFRKIAYLKDELLNRKRNNK